VDLRVNQQDGSFPYTGHKTPKTIRHSAQPELNQQKSLRVVAAGFFIWS